MGKKLAIVWNITLMLLTVVVLSLHAPSVYHQAHYQFTNPNGGSSMWPATFDGLFTLGSALIAIAAFSFLFSGSLGAGRRLLAGVLAFGLMVAWIVAASLWQHSDYSSGNSRYSLLAYMIRRESLFINVIGIAALTISAVVGKGPLTTFCDLFYTFRTRSRS